MRFNLIVLILITSCVKQELFVPKKEYKNEQVYVYVFLGGSNFSFNDSKVLKLAGGNVSPFEPNEIELFLIEDNKDTFFGVFDSNMIFQGFQGLGSGKQGSNYKLFVIHGGDTVSTESYIPELTENYIPEVDYITDNRYETKFKISNPNENVVYYNGKTNTYVGNSQSILSVNSMLQSGKSIKLIPEFNSTCELIPRNGVHRSYISMFNKEDYDYLIGTSELYENRNNPFYIPYNLTSEFNNSKFLGGMFVLQDTFWQYQTMDNSRKLMKVEVKEKDGSDLVKKNEGFNVSINIIDKENKRYQIQFRDTLSKIEFSENDFFYRFCKKVGGDLEALRDKEFIIYSSFIRDNNSSEVLSDSVYYNLNLPFQNIKLRLND